MGRHALAWCTRVNHREVRLWWPYNEALLDDFRACIPSHSRRWFREGVEMYWVVTGFHCDAAEAWFDAHFVSSDYQQSTWDKQQSSRAQPPPFPPPPKSSSDWDTLYLRTGASLRLIDSAYRWWAKQSHPDAGGNAQRMQEINSAYERLKKVAR